MRIQIVVLLTLLLCNFEGQAQQNVLEGDRECGCEVLLYTIETPNDGPTTDGVPPVYANGDLDEFVQTLNGQCKRSVHVLTRYLQNGVFAFREDFMVNDVNTLLDIYKDRTSFCLRGRFNASETIVLKRSKLLKLLDNSYINYTGKDGPVIDFVGSNNGIDGGGDGEIRTSTKMQQGVIRIESEGLALNGNNANYNHVKNIALVNTDPSINPTGLPDAANGSENLGIFLSNSPESIYEHSDNGTNFYTNISNVDITGFTTGLRARGWSNAVLVRDIRMEEITGYGIWVSGCIDNSFADIKFNNCNNATAIRLDNFVDARYENFEVAGTMYTLNDPNQRVAIDLINPINSLISSSSNNDVLLRQLLDLSHPLSYINDDLFGYNMIKEACGVDGRADYNNEVATSGDLLKFGFEGYKADEVDFPNYPDDLLNVFQVLPLTTSPEDDRINFFRRNFIHEVVPQTGPVQIELDKSTCEDAQLLTNFFRPAFFNSFSQVNIVDENSASQVNFLLEISGREDDETLCLESGANSAPCDFCQHEFNGRMINSVGSRNKIQVCGLPGSSTIQSLVDNKTVCDYTSGVNEVPIVTIVNQ